MKQTILNTSLCMVAAVAFIGCAGTRYSRSTGQYIDDQATAARVKAALAKDSLVKASDVKVESYRGDVHLTGFVDHPVQKERASQLTRNVKGVEWFKNDILVKGDMPTGVPMQTSGQQTFNQQFNGQQMNEPAGSGRHMMHHQQSFSSSSNSGNAGWQRGAINIYDPAAEITSRSSGDIQGNAASSSASYQNESAGASANISSEPAGSNNDLTQQVYTQLRSDNSDAAQNVRVESGANGKITLRGTVNSDADKNSIESKVKSVPGVQNVDDQLEVQNK